MSGNPGEGGVERQARAEIYEKPLLCSSALHTKGGGGHKDDIRPLSSVWATLLQYGGTRLNSHISTEYFLALSIYLVLAIQLVLV